MAGDRRDGRDASDDGEARSPDGPGFIVTCEHAGHVVLDPWKPLFAGAEDVLRSHRGWDPGAARIARALAGRLSVEPHLHLPTRLLVDVNRSLDHPACFSEWTSALDDDARAELVERIYRPHRAAVERAVAAAIEARGVCAHIAVHTFTPVLDGVEREADIGLLFDPKRPFECELVDAWRAGILARDRDLRVRFNYPYLGTDDGLTTTLRSIHPPASYAGIELEVNQKHASGGAADLILGALVHSVPGSGTRPTHR